MPFAGLGGTQTSSPLAPTVPAAHAGGLGYGGSNTGRGGGGGGGYYGGSAGISNSAGGGGSSWPGAPGVTHTQGYQSGNGQVIITW